MKKFYFGALNLIAAVLLPAGELVDLGQEGYSVNFPFKSKGQSGKIVPLDERSALRVEWNCAEAPHAEFQLQSSMLALPEFKKIKILVNVYIPAEDRKIKSLNLRLVDGDGEVIQLGQAIPSTAQNWCQLTYEIDATKDYPCSWGGKKNNHRIDFPVKINGFGIDFSSKSGVGFLGLGKIATEVIAADVKAVLDTGNPLFLVRSGTADQPMVRVINPANTAASVVLEYQLVDVTGNPVDADKAKLTVPAGGDARFALRKPVRSGVYYARFLIGSGELLKQPQVSFAVITPAGPSPGRRNGFIWGICDHPYDRSPEVMEKMALATALCGAKVMRTDAWWFIIQPKKGEWNFAGFDRTVATFGQYHVEIAPIFTPNASWSTAVDFKPFNIKRDKVDSWATFLSRKPELGYWSEYIRTVTARYKGKIHQVEIINEPDLSINFSQEEYLELLKSAYREVKQIDPTILVLSGGFATPDMLPEKSTDPDFMKKTIRDGNGYYDILAVHIHGVFDYYRGCLSKLEDMRNTLGDRKPWYSNETAVSSSGGTSDYEQAETLFMKLIYAWSRGAIGYNWYNLVEKDNYPLGHGERHYGLLTPDFHPKPAYVTYNMLAACYAEATFMDGQKYGDHLYAYRFKDRNNAYLFSHWNTGKSSRLLLVTNITGQASLIDLWGNETPLAVEHGTVALEVKTPGTLRVIGQTRNPQVFGDVIGFPRDGYLLPGTEKKLAFALTNPTATELDFILSIMAPPGVEIAPRRQTLRLAPGATTNCIFTFSTAPNFQTADGYCELAIGSIWQGRLKYKFETAKRLDAQFKANADFVLDNKAQVDILVPYSDKYSPLHWRGPDDLSGKIYLAIQNDELLLKAIVTDDIHSQPFRQAEIWKGDSIQFALQLPRQNTFWEIGLARGDSGMNMVHIWQAPLGFDVAKTINAIKLEIRHDENTKMTTYLATIPFSAIGLTAGIGKEGFRFNLLINDNDGPERESMIKVAPGLGGHRDASKYPMLCF